LINTEGKNLEGNLKLEGFINLEELSFSGNQLTDLNLNDCQFLTTLNCSINNLTNTDFLTNLPNPDKLKILDLGDNNFAPQCLNFLENFVNLEELRLWTC
jgi:hypothetical protein